jgi:nicotinamidase-related amidase
MTDPPSLIDPSRTALVLMDYQNRILGMVDDLDALLARANQAVEVVRAHGGHVAYVRVGFTDADFEDMPATSSMAARVASAGQAFHADSPATAIHDRVAPLEGDIVVRKRRVGAFSTTDLADQLRERGVDTLILAGVSTSGCVLSTVRDASDRDYRLIVLADACFDPEPEVHVALTERVFPRQAEVMNVSDLEARLA